MDHFRPIFKTIKEPLSAKKGKKKKCKKMQKMQKKARNIFEYWM